MRPAIARAGPPTAYRVSAVSQQIQVSSYNDMSGLETESTADTAGGYDVGYAAVGSWAEYQNIDFGSGVSSVNVRVASDGSGGNLEFHLDAVSGPLVGTATMPVTGRLANLDYGNRAYLRATGVRTCSSCSLPALPPAGVANLNWFSSSGKAAGLAGKSSGCGRFTSSDLVKLDHVDLRDAD